MRAIRVSRDFQAELVALLSQGLPRFGAAVVAEKRNRVLDTIENHLVRHPRRPVDPALGLCAYPVSGTPFVILYDYDDNELRVHLIIHGAMDRSSIDLSQIEW